MCISRKSLSISIEFANPGGVFEPGGKLRGVVVLEVARPIRARSVLVGVYGRARTSWKDDLPHDPDGYQPHYDATVIYVCEDSEIWSESRRQKKLLPGVHHLPFKFVMPKTCPPSFEGFAGDIRYEVEVEIDRPWRCNKKERREFTVPPLLDLNTVPRALQPAQSVVKKDVGLLLKHGVIIMQASIPKVGYAPGEKIVLDAVIENGSSRPIIEGDIHLIQVTRYRAVENGWIEEYGPDLSIPSRFFKWKEVDNISERNMSLSIAPKSKSSFRFCLLVPPTTPSFNLCPIITVEYYVELTIASEGSVNNLLSADLPVLIGTVPIRTAEFVPTVIPFVPSAQPTAALSSPRR